MNLSQKGEQNRYQRLMEGGNLVGDGMERVLRTEESKSLVGWSWGQWVLASKGYSVELLLLSFHGKSIYLRCDLVGVRGFWDLGHVWILDWEEESSGLRQSGRVR